VLSRYGRPLGVPALSDQLAAGAITMGERLGSDDAQVLDTDRRIFACADCIDCLAACAQIRLLWGWSAAPPTVTAWPGVVVGDPGRLQLDHAPGGVVHLRYRQAEPVPQAPEPFAAGPGDRLFQLLPVEEVSRAGGGARHGCRTRCGQAAWVFMLWCRMIQGHCGLLGWLGRACPGCLPGIGG